MLLALSPTTSLSKMTLHSSRSAVTAVCVSMTLVSIASLVYGELAGVAKIAAI